MADKLPATVAIANQKGGVGKTTTAINLGAALAMRGVRTLIVDLDPQGNASTGLGIASDRRESTSHDLLSGVAVEPVDTEIENLSIIPATADLSSIDVELADDARRAVRLRQALNGVSRETEIVLIDCPPSLNLLTVNAMVAAGSVLVPLQCEFFALEGLSQLLLTVREIRRSINPQLRIEGVVLTMHDRRNNLSRQVERDAREYLEDLVFDTVIPRNVRVSEAPSFAKPVVIYDPQSAGARAYFELADEFLARMNMVGAEHGTQDA